MSLTVGEATAINTVLDYWLKMPREGLGPVTEKAVLAAMIDLADRATKTLMAGVNGNDVRRAWRQRDKDALSDELRALAVKLRVGGAPDAAAIVAQAVDRIGR